MPLVASNGGNEAWAACPGSATGSDHLFVAAPGRQRGAACGDRPKPDMERTTLSTVLQVLTLVISLVGAIGVLIINSKVDRLTGRIEDVNARTAIIAAVAGGG